MQLSDLFFVCCRIMQFEICNSIVLNFYLEFPFIILFFSLSRIQWLLHCYLCLKTEGYSVCILNALQSW